jgi:hypothetical protein
METKKVNWGAGSFTAITKYVHLLIEYLYFHSVHAEYKTIRSVHKALFRSPFKFLHKHCNYPKSKVLEPDSDYRMLQDGEVIVSGDEYYDQVLDEWYPTVCSGALKTQDSALYRRKIDKLDCASKAAEVTYDPNTKIVSYASHKIGDKYSVCVVFETDKEPFEYVKGKEYLSTQIVMATGEPLP